jgi:hypothetical protein
MRGSVRPKRSSTLPIRNKDDKEASQNPDNVKLNLVVEGSGPVWINDIRLEKVGL